MPLIRCLSLCIACLVLQACPAPGEGKKAEHGYAVCQPIIEALERYHQENRSYPDTLDVLIPEYIEGIPEEVHGYPILYNITEESYRLRFSYEQPGMNHCDYMPETGWKCYGYY
ncbi:hypothetical protein U27_05290 [Candidatus Vecturithrix granuli]|uniref:Type II secretion system protein G n=1 Tax=Vecturithrix granuli TaxID=1499967 RepID=A0A081C161_VECG1|nr:hypothetical protein U27_05290 [Candidatus Vecturithrix granuli]